MTSNRVISTGAVVLYAILCSPLAARAQYGATPFQDPATGEGYHIEAAWEFWHPPLNLKVASESLPGIQGTVIDASTDLGLANKTLPELRIVLRPAKKHKLRLSYLPMTYSGQSDLHRTFVFNGQSFGLNLPITTDLQWTTWQVTYEYDFAYTDRWFAGLTLNSKFTKVQVDIQSQIGSEFAIAQAPVPTLGGIARVYVVPNISVTADINGIKIPDSISPDYRAHYFDFDLYGTVNFTENVGAQLGYRSLDVGYTFKKDEGAFLMKGLYFGGIVRY